MTGEEQRLGRKTIKILLQKPEVLQEGVKRCRTEVVGEGWHKSWKHSSIQELPPPLNSLDHLAGGTMAPFFRGDKLMLQKNVPPMPDTMLSV